MGNAEIEGSVDHGAGIVVVVDTAEVVPETERDSGQLETAAAAAVVGHSIVPTIGR